MMIADGWNTTESIKHQGISTQLKVRDGLSNDGKVLNLSMLNPNQGGGRSIIESKCFIWHK